MVVGVDTVTSDPIPALEPKHTCRSHTIVLRNSRRFPTKHTFTATTTRPSSLLSSTPGGLTHLWTYYPMQNRQTQKRTHTAQATSYKIRKRKNDQKNKRRKWRIDVNIDGNRSLSKLVITLCTSTEAWVGWDYQKYTEKHRHLVIQTHKTQIQIRVSLSAPPLPLHRPENISKSIFISHIRDLEH